MELKVQQWGEEATCCSFQLLCRMGDTKNKKEKRPLYLDTEYTDGIVPTNEWFKGREPSHSGSTKCSELAKNLKVLSLVSYLSVAQRKHFKKILTLHKVWFSGMLTCFIALCAFTPQWGKSKEHNVPQKKSQVQRGKLNSKSFEEPMVMPPSNDMPTR